MADRQNNKHQQSSSTKTEGGRSAAPAPPVSSDRGLFDFAKKKEEEKPQADLTPTDSDKLEGSGTGKSKVEVKKHGGGLLEKAHRIDDYSSSSLSDEEGNDEEKNGRKEKKGIKEKIMEKLPGHKKQEEGNKGEPGDTTRRFHEKHWEDKGKIHAQELPNNKPEENIGFLDMMKDKIPAAGQHEKKKADQNVTSLQTPLAAAAADQTGMQAPEFESPETEAEKKGFLDKIKDKIPGFNSKSEEEKEKEKKDKEENEKKEKERTSTYV